MTPDRFDERALELYRYCKLELGTDQPASYDCPHPSVDDVAAALRAAESSALERAAQDYDEEAQRLEQDARRYDADGEGMAAAAHFHYARVAEANANRIRALKPDPAAAPAADGAPCTCHYESAEFCRYHGPLLKAERAAPAAETGKEPDWWQDAINKSAATNRSLLARIAELEAALREARAVIDRDRTGLAAGLNAVTSVVRGYTWIASGEWSGHHYTEQNEKTLRAEVKNAFEEIAATAAKALSESGRLASESCRAIDAKLAARTPQTGEGR